uniref:DIS3-like exonuclease 1 n=1 Tax=Strigamia maritima TaxID=126957 RepID=T1IWQ4_STRMM
MLGINFSSDKTNRSTENVVTKADRQVIITSGRLKSKVILREQYLRKDIPCQCILCPEQCKNDEKTAILSADNTHYLIPCFDVVGKYLEILEYNDLVGILFLQTVVTKCLSEFGKRHYNRICSKIRDKNNKCIYFPNEFSFFTFKHRNPNESCSHWQTRNIYSAAVWYYKHLGGNMPIVLVTENEQTINEYQNKSVEVFVLSLGNYLTTFWPNLTAVHELYFSLNASLTDNLDSKNDEKEYVEYLPQEILQNGISTGKYHQGKLRVNKHHAHLEAFLSISSSDSKSKVSDILIPGMKNRNRAIHGDVVVVELLPRTEWKGKIQTLNEGIKEKDNGESTQLTESKPSGKVVGILQQYWRNYVATVPNDANCASRRPGDSVLVIPYDYRIPKIRIFTRQIDTLINQRIIVRIDSWKVSSQYPNGHFVQILGPVDNLDTETTVLLVENGISTSPFSNGVMAEMLSEDWKITESEIEERRDLRESHLIFSIDPKGSEDVDDALSIKYLPNGNWELGVHIADVTHYVIPESLTDLEARSRSTTVYLADRRFDMLPRILNSNICSLLGNVDRCAVSVLWEIDSKYEVRGVEFDRSVIKSAYQLTYEVAEEIVNKKKYQNLEGVITEFSNLNEKEKEKKYSALRKSLLKLTDISRNLKLRRLNAGALELESIEVQFVFKQTNEIDGDEGVVANVYRKQSLEVHETVAECMILANSWVAKTIFERFPRQALLRRHPPARQEHFKDLIQCADVKGFRIDTSTNKSLANSLNQSLDREDQIVNNLLRQLATQAMSSAEYFSSGESDKPSFSHYGLALEFYTHFTSPIRRYADVLVHRLLLACIDKNEQKTHLMSSSDLKEVCQHINTKHKVNIYPNAAQDIQKSSQHLFQTLFFLNTNDDEHTLVDAVIFSIRPNGVLVYISRYGIKGPVYLKNRENQVAFVVNKSVEWIPGCLENETSSITIKTNLEPQKYKLFDHITVRICVVPSHTHAHSFRLDLISNCPLATDFKRGQDAKLPCNVPTKCEQVKY